MTALGLSLEALARRRLHIMAGDAKPILEGRWREVWESKMGARPDDDLSGELRVQMGLYTEPLNLAWAERRTGRGVEYYTGSPLLADAWHALTGRVSRSDEFQVSGAYPFMACHLDGMTTTPQGHYCVIDAKHVGRADEQAILNYTAAGTHQATVMGVDWWALSFFVGNGKWEVTYQEVDVLFQASLIAKEREFWRYVEAREAPPDGASAPVLAPKPRPKLRQIILDLTPEHERPNWAGEFTKLARTFAETEGAAKAHAITRESMKTLVPDDVGLVQLGLVRFKRDARGVTIALDKVEGNDEP